MDSTIGSNPSKFPRFDADLAEVDFNLAPIGSSKGEMIFERARKMRCVLQKSRTAQESRTHVCAAFPTPIGRRKWSIGPRCAELEAKKSMLN